jgi:hypothetical protein
MNSILNITLIEKSVIDDQLKQFFDILPTFEQLKHVHLLLEVEKNKYET